MLKKNHSLTNHRIFLPHHSPMDLADDEALLKSYLNSSDREREQKFAPPSIACKIVGRSPRTIQRWIEAGFIRAVYIVGRYQVELASLKTFVQKQMHSHGT